MTLNEFIKNQVDLDSDFMECLNELHLSKVNNKPIKPRFYNEIK